MHGKREDVPLWHEGLIVGGRKGLGCMLVVGIEVLGVARCSAEPGVGHVEWDVVGERHDGSGTVGGDAYLVALWGFPRMELILLRV